MNDPIADMISRIRNAASSGNSSLSVPYSKLKEELAIVLDKKGFLKNIRTEGKGVIKTLNFDIAMDGNESPKVKGLTRVSKLSRRIYVGYKDMRPVKFGHGHLIVSTSKGIMTDSEARESKTGGEALFKIW